MPRPALPVTDILIDAAPWRNETGCETIVQSAIDAAATAAGAVVGGAELAILLTDDANIRALNRDWRGIDKPTNVLSFPAAHAPTQDDNSAPPMLGDIAIAYETTRREAETEHKLFANHLSHLAVHGFLHLIGYDHETDDEANVMEDLERQILAKLGIPDPYAEDTHVAAREGNSK
jgi:probable rRNA maturation factor